MNQYEAFYQLHQQATPLIIANIWDVQGARIVEAAGFRAIGTSSGAVANALGYEDGENLPFEELLYMVRRIRSAVSLPLTVDMESGYSNDPEILNGNIQKLLDAGVSGINLEDAQGEETYLKKLTGVKNYLARTNATLFINARTDAFLQKLDSPLEKTLNRAKLYKDAGADGLFVTAVPDTETIRTITSSTSLPVNVVGSPKFPSVATLAGCGVRRISMAVSLFRATYRQLETLVKNVQKDQSVASLY